MPITKPTNIRMPDTVKNKLRKLAVYLGDDHSGVVKSLINKAYADNKAEVDAAWIDLPQEEKRKIMRKTEKIKDNI